MSTLLANLSHQVLVFSPWHHGNIISTNPGAASPDSSSLLHRHRAFQTGPGLTIWKDKDGRWSAFLFEVCHRIAICLFWCCPWIPYDLHYASFWLWSTNIHKQYCLQRHARPTSSGCLWTIRNLRKPCWLSGHFHQRPPCCPQTHSPAPSVEEHLKAHELPHRVWGNHFHPNQDHLRSRSRWSRSARLHLATCTLFFVWVQGCMNPVKLYENRYGSYELCIFDVGIEM